jgi:hypothetical protein
MLSFLSKAFGGLSRRYYFSNFIFGVFISSLVITSVKLPLTVNIFVALNAFLFPYSRFVFDSIGSFLLGNTIIVMPLFITLFYKMMLTVLCFFYCYLYRSIWANLSLFSS